MVDAAAAADVSAAVDVAAAADVAEVAAKLGTLALMAVTPKANAAAASISRRGVFDIVHPPLVTEDEVRPLRHPFGMPNEPPFLRGSVSLTQNRRPDSSPEWGFTVAGQCRDLTGLRWNLCHSVVSGANATLADEDAYRRRSGLPTQKGHEGPLAR